MNGVFLALTIGKPSSKVGEGVLTPPTVAPVLTVSADFTSYDALLQWTTSDKTGSSGFGYNIYRFVDGAGPVLLTTVGNVLFYTDSNPGAYGQLYEYFVIPKNDAGEGPSSNTASVILPGVS